jgi:tetratricopeptide (TPR) repeat protein
LNEGQDPREFARAQTLFSQALRIDPDNVCGRRSSIRPLRVSNFNTENGAQRLAAAERNAARAFFARPRSPQAHFVFGSVMGVAKRNERATAEPWQALDPNLACAHAFMRLHALHLGGAEKIEGYIREAVRPSLFDSFAYFWFSIAGFSKNALGRYEEAIVWLRQGMSRNSTFDMAHFHLGSALVHLCADGPSARARLSRSRARPAVQSRELPRRGAQRPPVLFRLARAGYRRGMREAGAPGE